MVENTVKKSNKSMEEKELDLDSLLQSHLLISGAGIGSDDDDVSISGVPHRTVDEILLNHSSSSSSPSPSPPSSPSTSYRRYDVVSSSGSPKTLPAPHVLSSSLSLPQQHSNSQYLLEDSNFNYNNPNTNSYNNNNKKNSINSTIKSGQFSSYSLFGGVRSNAKPGAALAAAAAASRSIPTPHAAAIKSRRANLLVLHKEDDSGEEKQLSSSASSSTDHSNTAGVADPSERLRKLVSKEEDDNWDSSQSQLPDGNQYNSDRKEVSCGDDKNEVEEDNVDRVDERLETATDKVLLAEETQIEAETASVVVGSKVDQVAADDSDDHDDSGFHIGEASLTIETSHLDLAENRHRVSVLDESKDSELQSVKDGGSADEVYLTKDEITEKEISSTSVSGKGEISDEGVTELVGEMKDQEEMLVPPSKHGEEVSLGGDETSLQNDAADLIEDLTLQWESERGSRKTRKKSASSLKPLELAEELEKKQAFTGLHWEEGAAAQPMRLEGVRRGSTVLGYFDVDAHNIITQTISSQAFRRDYGSPQVLAVHINYIAVGMSRGVIVVVPSKYAPHHVDNMDPKMLMLGLQGDRSYVPVTSMCFNQQGDLLFAGYGDGHYTVWDVPRVSALKVINEHKAPVVHMLYLGHDSQVTRQFNVVSGDTKGVVKLIRFSVVPLLNRISYSKPVKLLDETTSTVVCASPLFSGEIHGGTLMSSQGSTVSTGGIGSMMGGVVGGDAGWKLFEGSSSVEEGVVIFVTHQSALVAKVSPTVEVYAQLPKPDGVREGAMPYAAWKYMAVSEGLPPEAVTPEIPERVSLLVIAWDRQVQVAKLVKSELKVYRKWTLDSPAVGVAWLNDQMLVVLMSFGQLCLFSKDGNVIHQTSFDVDGSRGDDLISYHTYFSNNFGNPEKAHHNCVSVRGATMYILGPTHLVVSRLLPWKERIEVLRRAGDWMGALYMAMTLYDGQAQGVIDLPRNLNDVQKTVMPSLVQLLFSYVDEVFSYIKVACGEPGEKLNPSAESNDRSNSEAKEQYSRVGGVAVEYCLHIKRTDILFDEIYTKFNAIGHQETFLELLEPYILKDMLGSLPPGIMQALVEHYSQKGWLQRVEQCVLHMDILSLDFNQVVRLCREHRLHGALIYLFNKGLDDFSTPLEELLVILRDSPRESAPAVGYRILIYLKYCFQGLAFPPGHGSISPARLPSLRKELLQFLLENSSVPNSWAVTSLPSDGAFTNLHHLLELDTEATLDVLKFAFVEDELLGTKYPLQDSANLSVLSTEAEDDSSAGDHELVQKLVDVLCVILDMSYFQTGSSTNSDNGTSIEIWPSKKDVDHIFEFIAYYVAFERAKVSKDILSQIVEHLTSEVNVSSSASQQTSDILKRREKQLLALLEVVPETDWDAPYLLHLCGKAQFHQACGLIHAIGHHYSAALDCYMKAVDEPICAFSFIHYMLQKLGDKESNNFRSAVISRIPELIRLNREGTFFLVLYHFSGQSQHIMSELSSHPESLFLYLKTVIEVHSHGTINFSCLRKCDVLDFPTGKGLRHQSDRVEAFQSSFSDLPKLLCNNAVPVTDDMIELYLELLCRYERESVLKFLETFESYRVDHCLRLCQEYGIIDAAAFLLERVGDVGSALLLLLSDLNGKFVMLSETMESESQADLKNFDTTLKKKEVNDIHDTVRASIGLCQRNSSRLDPHESEFLWFQLLDSFCEPLLYGTDSESASRRMAHLDVSLGNQEDEEASKIKWKVPKSHKCAHVLRKLLSMFIKEIVEGMIGYVRLPEIMLKLLSDNGTQEFGDFKFTILGMLGTYDFERRILDTAKSLIEDDTYYTMSLLKKGASHGYAPRSLLCCLCNCLLTKNASGSGIQVYSCGHATHLHCELQENGTSARELAGCPICMPKKKAQRSRSKSGLAENGLVNTSSSRSQQTHSTLALHLHDPDAFENSHNSHQISRFELLNNLQKDQRTIQIENVPQLRLAPPSLYHEKVKKGTDLIRGESSSVIFKMEKPIKTKPLRDVKVKGSSIRFPLRSNIFRKEKIIKQ